MENKNLFWTNNFKILYNNENYLNFLPNKSMSRFEQLNAITRFCLYLIILCLLFGVDRIWYQIPLIIIILIVVLVHINIIKNNIVISEGVNVELETEPETDNSPDNNDVSIQAGQYDNNGILSFPSDYKSKPIKKKRCRMPTKDNPYMNPEVYDALEDDPPIACNADDVDIDALNKQVSNKFNDELFRDTTDLFEVKNSQRQFYTISGSKTPDTVGFANWLYGNMPACQSNQTDCYKYEDLSRKPLVFL